MQVPGHPPAPSPPPPCMQTFEGQPAPGFIPEGPSPFTRATEDSSEQTRMTARGSTCSRGAPAEPNAPRNESLLALRTQASE